MQTSYRNLPVDTVKLNRRKGDLPCHFTSLIHSFMQQGERLPDSLEASTVAMVINVQISIRMLWNYFEGVDTKKKEVQDE